MPSFSVRYQAGSYSGIITVKAEDEDEAIDLVKGHVHKEMTLPMYSESYRVISEKDNEDDN